MKRKGGLHGSEKEHHCEGRLLLMLVVSASIAGISLKRTSDHRFSRYVMEKEPLGSEHTWVSDDGNSYIVGETCGATAYFKGGEEWRAYALHCRGRLACLEDENGNIPESDPCRMKFAGTTIALFELSKDVFENEEYRYIGAEEKTGQNEKIRFPECSYMGRYRKSIRYSLPCI